MRSKKNMDDNSAGETNAWSFTNLDTAPLESEHSDPNASTGTPGDYFGEESKHAAAIDRVLQDRLDDDMDDDASDVSYSQYSDDANSQDGDGFKVEEDEDTFPTIRKERYNIDLTGDEPIIEARPDRVVTSIDWSRVEGIIELSDGEDDFEFIVADQTERTTSARVKTEPGLSPKSHPQNDTAPNENVEAIAEQGNSPSHFENEEQNPSHEERRITDPNIIGSTASTDDIKKEQGTPPPVWEREMGKDAIDLTAPFGGLRPQFRARDFGQLNNCQRMLMQSMKQNRPTYGAAGTILESREDAQQESGKQATLADDGFEWMMHIPIPDDTQEYDFHEVERIWKDKKRHRKNTIPDDINYKRAQKEYNQRHKCSAYDEDETNDNEAEESDEGVFMPDDQFMTSLVNDPYGEHADDEGVNKNQDNEVNENQVLIDALNQELGKPTEAIKSKDVDQRKANKEANKERDRAWNKEKSIELYHNMMAGIEVTLLKDQMRREKKAIMESDAAEKAKTGTKKRKKKAKGTQGTPTKRTKTGRLSNIRSLTKSNVYDDSNANLEKQLLPTVSETKKKDFLTSLIAEILPEEKKRANQDRIDILKATKVLGDRKVRPDGRGSWSFTGMRSSLYHYQVQGSAAMKLREKGDSPPKGGLLCDEMGLGKTIQVIATMVAHRQEEPDRPKCTLIVCAPALLQQWEDEIQKHCDSKKVLPDIVRHYGRTHVSGTKGAERMEASDVVLTTYKEVVRSYPHCIFPPDLEGRAEKQAYWKGVWQSQRDLLHRAFFYRVVLDEAHCIKNHTSQTSIACRALMARHRWAVTGTPIHNRLEELFPYFKFLRVKHTGTMSIFRENYCRRDNQTCLERLVSMLSVYMIRRTHADTVLGSPLYVLPKNTQVTIRLKFNKIEESIYNLVRARCVHAINNRARMIDLERDPKFVIMMFQRLRQMVAHIFSVQDVIEEIMDLDDVQSRQEWLDKDGASSDDRLEQAMIDGLRRMISEKGEPRSSSEESGPPANTDDAELDRSKSHKSNVLITKFARLLRGFKGNSNWTELKARTLCQYCGAVPDEPWVTSCFHLFCKECLQNLHHEAADKGLDNAECSNCRHRYKDSAPCGHLKELEVRDLSATVFQENDKDKPIKKRSKPTMRYVDFDGKLVPSTKILAVKKQLAKWIEEDPSAKIIVFSEWLMVMHLVSRICQKENWKSCQYNGKMTQTQRVQAVLEFEKNSSIKVMVASLKCGGTGLNLTAASKVICVDLWYNKSVEQQAFCRVHRIGQKKETYITRFMVEGTVDEKLLAMQEYKQIEIDSAIDNRSILSQLSMDELLGLFGTVGRDEFDRPFIMVDDDAMMQKLGGPKNN